MNEPENSMDDFKKDLEDYFCRFTFGQFVTLILLEIVTLFFVFYLGAHYGADLIGSKQESAQKEKDNSGLPKEGGKSVDEIVGSPAVDYTYPEVLSDRASARSATAKGVRVKPSGMTAADYEKQGQVPTVNEEKPALPETPAVAEVKSEPVKKSEELESPPIETKSAPKGKFAIQVGSYQTAVDAAASVKRWKEKGYAAFMTVGEIPEKGTWYRVRIGGFSNRKNAAAFLSRFKSKEKTSGLVVPSKS